MAFRIAALLIIATFYVCYILKMFRQHKKGIKTDRLGKGKSGFVKRIELTVKISAYLTLIAEMIDLPTDDLNINRGAPQWK